MQAITTRAILSTKAKILGLNNIATGYTTFTLREKRTVNLATLNSSLQSVRAREPEQLPR